MACLELHITWSCPGLGQTSLCFLGPALTPHCWRDTSLWSPAVPTWVMLTGAWLQSLSIPHWCHTVQNQSNQHIPLILSWGCWLRPAPLLVATSLECPRHPGGSSTLSPWHRRGRQHGKALSCLCWDEAGVHLLPSREPWAGPAHWCGRRSGSASARHSPSSVLPFLTLRCSALLGFSNPFPVGGNLPAFLLPYL